MDTRQSWPDEATMIPNLLQQAPQVRAVLDRYGLHGCGGAWGPEESLGFFARAHEAPLEEMLAELRAAVRQPSPLETPHVDYQPAPGDTIYRPFFKAGIAVVLTLGAVWGAYLLLRIALTGQFASAGLHEVNAHGHAQIFGWVGLFVMGFAYQAFPRFKHTDLAWPALALGTLAMMLTGLVVRSVAEPLSAWAPRLWSLRSLAVAASGLEVAAIALFVVILAVTWRRSGKPLVFYDGFIVAALFWFFAQAVYESIYLVATLAAEGPALVALVAAWQPALRDMQIHGFALMMILGVSQRIFHHFFGLPEPNPRRSLVALGLLNLAIVGELTGLILMGRDSYAWAGLWYASAVLLAGTVVFLVSDWRIFSRTDDQDHDRSLKFLRAAYVWLFVSLAMLTLLPAYQYGLLPWLAADSGAAAQGFSHAYYGAIRHAITVGFVSLMIVGVAAKVVPTLNGLASQRLSPLWGPFVLINLGCGLRVFGQTLTDFTPAAFPIAGVSGLLEVTGLAMWGVHLWLIMIGRPRLRELKEDSHPSATPVDDGPLRADHTVGAILERYPELLDVFVSFGFKMLANRRMRRTIAHLVSVERACRRMGVDADKLLAALNQKRPAQPPASPHEPKTYNIALPTASPPRETAAPGPAEGAAQATDANSRRVT